jgi:hypothetical protein
MGLFVEQSLSDSLKLVEEAASGGIGVICET